MANMNSFSSQERLVFWRRAIGSRHSYPSYSGAPVGWMQGPCTAGSFLSLEHLTFNEDVPNVFNWTGPPEMAYPIRQQVRPASDTSVRRLIRVIE